MAKKKIAFLNIYQERVDRGAETFVNELSRRLKKKYEVVVFSGKRDTLERWPILWRFFLDPPGIQIFLFTLKLLPKIWKEKFDIVIPVNGGWQPALIRIITWMYGGKMVISGQSGIGWDDRNNIWSFPNVFVGISSFAKSWAKKVNPFVRSVYISNGVDLKSFKETSPALKVSLQRPVILSVAALELGKRINLIIKAVAKIKTGSLLVVGKGAQKKSLEDLGRKLLPFRFKTISAPYEKMPGVYTAADIFTYATNPTESFGNVMVEAMASGLPVVATDDPIRREIVGEAGIFVNPEDTNAYALALEKALETNWGVKPRAQAEKFSWDKISKKYEKLFFKLLK